MGFWNRSSRLDPNNDVFSKMNDLVSRIDSVERWVKGYQKALDNVHQRIVNLEKKRTVDDLILWIETRLSSIIRRIEALDLMIKNGQMAGFSNDKLMELINERDRLKQELRKASLEVLAEIIVEKILRK